jgi:hypothetical protein
LRRVLLRGKLVGSGLQPIHTSFHLQASTRRNEKAQPTSPRVGWKLASITGLLASIMRVPQKSFFVLFIAVHCAEISGNVILKIRRVQYELL